MNNSSVNLNGTMTKSVNRRRSSRAADAENQSAVAVEAELKAWLNRDNKPSPSSSLAARPSKLMDPPTDKISTASMALILALQDNVQRNRRNEKAQEALDEASRKKQGPQKRRSSAGSGVSVSGNTSRASKTKSRSSQKAVERPTSSNTSAPNFNVDPFEQLSGNNDHVQAPLESGHASVYSVSSHTSRASKENCQTLSTKVQKEKSHCDDDDASEISQGSETTYSSVFTNTCTKLKGYLPPLPYKPKNKNKNRNRSNFPASEDGSFPKRKPKYRSSTSTPSLGSKNSTAVTVTSDNTGCSPTGIASLSSYDNVAKKPMPAFDVFLPNMHMVEDGPSCMGTASVYPRQCNTIKVATKGSESDSSRNSSVAGATQVFDLPWADNTSGGRLHGLYSGPANELLQPHGEGALVLEANSFLKFYGHWVNGEMVSPLINEDEKRDLGGYVSASECSMASSKRYKEYKKKSSTSSVQSNYSNESSKKYKKKSSKEYRKKSSTSSTARSTSSSVLPMQKYVLGEVARTPRDMVIHRSNEKAGRSASLLEQYDQAFLKRSNGLWTCAVLADRALQPKTAARSHWSHWYTKEEIDEETMELEESMLFVINEDGATKIVKKRHWGRFIRCLQQDSQGKEGD